MYVRHAIIWINDIVQFPGSIRWRDDVYMRKMSPHIRRQAIIQTNDYISPIIPQGINFSENQSIFIDEIAHESCRLQLCRHFLQGKIWVKSNNEIRAFLAKYIRVEIYSYFLPFSNDFRIDWTDIVDDLFHYIMRFLMKWTKVMI